MKVMKKLLVFVIIFSLGVIFVQNTSMAFNWTSRISSTANASSSNSAVTATQNVGKVIISIARVISMGVAVTMLIVLAMKYMSAAPGEKATFKKSAVTYVVGAIVMFAASVILAIIDQFAGAIS